MLLDFSLGLVNRTGAFYLGRDIETELGHLFRKVRYWRISADSPPDGVIRKVLAEAMFVEMGSRIRRGRFPSPPPGEPVIHLDPLYVLNSGVRPTDVVLCHDLGPITNPELYHAFNGYVAAYQMIARAKPGMVFVSDASRRIFGELYGTDFRFMRTIPLYVRQGASEGAEEPVEGVGSSFLLCVGAVGARKNQKRLIDAFEASRLHGAGVSLVIVGAREHGFGEVAAAAAQTAGVVLRPYLPETQLRWLYRHALAFCLPSLLEGFGMPALEAAAHGLLPVVSAGGALEEAVGSNAILVDPASTTSIAEGLKAAVNMDRSKREQLIVSAKQHARALSREQFIESWRLLLEAEREGMEARAQVI